ncbi:MAG: Gfo/Idh/MocA family oxidoreductase [Dehalococcoidia bacterium]|jgi:predicted dehydrogenase|nr:Gfo/Idh/MocA family oxidoreductase [Dehalococcoidia bacterium]
MASEQLRVGFIGAGQIATLHALAYEDNRDATLHAIADQDADVRAARGAEWGVGVAYADYRELLGNPDIDAVEIILPHHLHLPVTLEALAAGKHVSLQKPMCLSLGEADQIIAAAEGSDRLFRVFENFRSYEPYRLAKKLIDQGEIGDPLSLRMKNISGRGVGGWSQTTNARAWRSDTERSGGYLSILDHGYHMASIATHLMGHVESVHTLSTPKGDSVVPATQEMITFRFAEGDRLGSWETVRAPELLVRTKYYGGDEWVEVTGTRGVVWVNRCSGDLLGIPPVTLYRDGELRQFSDLDTDWDASFRDGGMEFTRAIVDGTQPDLDATEAKAVLAFCLAAVESKQTGRTTLLAELDQEETKA